MIGKTLSHFKVIEKIGQGGMGEVYRAEDTNLSREVAIKVLPEQFTQDPQRLARFEREAKLLASLNHPNIAAIHSFEHSDDIHFLVLELVPGETLAERVAKGPLPVEEALEVCRQIAEGVEAAHEKGVIHRDLKPANVKVTPEGKVKILDFGLAKAFEDEIPAADISQSPTLTEEMTRAGVILGTAAYMSPEQARGEEVDKRADIFAFGCVLYELLTGKRTFSGKTITETLGAIIHKEPDWEALPGVTPGRIKELLDDCLQKEVHNRVHDVSQVRIQIKKALEKPIILFPIGAVSATKPPLWKRVIPWSLASVAVIVAGVAIWSLTRPEVRPITRFPLVLPSDQQPTGADRHVVALSPDGTHLVYTANQQLYLRPMDQLEAIPIRGTEGGSREPFFSPDGQWVGFWVGGQLRKVPISGGAPVTLCEAVPPFGASWGQDDTIVFGQGPQGILKVSANGGTPEVLVTMDSAEGAWAHGPQILPGGEAVLFTLVLPGVPWDQAQIVVQSLETGERRVLISGGKDARYAPTGHLVYAQAGTLLAVPFDLKRLEVTRGPVPLVEGVADAGNVTGAAHFKFSSLGSLVYMPGALGRENSLVWVDREGTERPVTAEKRDFTTPRISPDGRQISVAFYEDGERHAWIYNIERDSFSRLTFEGVDNAPLIWTRDGNWITFQSNRDGPNNLYQKPADGSGPAERLTTSESTQIPTSWTPDGSVLAFHAWSAASPRDIWLLPMEGDGEPQLLISSPNTDGAAAFSPDGHWLAYVSDETGQPHVYVRPYPELRGKWLVSGDESGGDPVWSPDGTELFYRSGDKMMVVSVQMEPTFSADKPRVLFEGSYLTSVTIPGFYPYYDMSPDGKRFLMIKKEGADQAQINVVLNWFEELKRLVPTN